MQENNENEFLDQQEDYALPEKRDIALDLEKKETVDLSSLPPIEMIRLTAKENGIELKEFPLKKKNNFQFDTGCRRPGCYGRGYKGWDGKIPVPCVCLFKPEHRDAGKNAINRKINRDFDKYAKNQSRRIIEIRAKVYGLTNSHGGIWVSKNGTEFRWSNIKGKWDFRTVKDLERAAAKIEKELDGE